MSNDYMQRYQFVQMKKSVEDRNGKKIKLRWKWKRLTGKNSKSEFLQKVTQNHRAV